MALTKITFTDKVDAVNPDLPDNKRNLAADWNEIKDRTNALIDYQNSLGSVFKSDGTRISDATGQAITSGVRTKLLVDGTGATTSTIYRNAMPVNVWDEATSNITPEFAGDHYYLRLAFEFKASTGTGDKEIKLELDIGDGSPIPIYTEDKPIIKGTDPQVFTAELNIFCGTTFLANGGEIYITTDVDGSLFNANALLQRTITGSIYA